MFAWLPPPTVRRENEMPPLLPRQSTVPTELNKPPTGPFLIFIAEKQRAAGTQVGAPNLRRHSAFIISLNIRNMSLQAFIDDSGTHTNHSPVCVAAGYFGGAHYWKQFDLDWERVVKNRGLAEFHASRFWAGGLGGKTVGAYAGWTKEDCESFLDELLRIIARYKIWPIGSAVVIADWNVLGADERAFLSGALFREGKYQKGGAPTKPYFMPFLFAVQGVARYCDAGHPVDFVVDESTALNGYARNYFQEIKISNFQHADKLGTIRSGDSKTLPGLQAADLLAYLTLRRTRERPEIGQEIDSDSPLGRAVKKARNLKGDFKLLGKLAFDRLLKEFRKDLDIRLPKHHG